MKRTKLLYLFICLVLSILHSTAQTSTIYPKDDFAVVESKYADGKPIIGSVNLGYKNYDKKAQYPWCLKISVGLDLKHCTKNGLPLKSESDIANKFEDGLFAEIKKLATVHYIGHIYNDTFLDIYIYLDDPKKVHAYLQTQINKKGLIRPFSYEIKEDFKWGNVEQFLK